MPGSDDWLSDGRQLEILLPAGCWQSKCSADRHSTTVAIGRPSPKQKAGTVMQQARLHPLPTNLTQLVIMGRTSITS